MAVASLAMQLTDYQDAACAEIFGGSAGYSGLAAAEQAVIDRLILRAERTLFAHPPVDPPHVWTCLRDPGAITLWTDVAVAAAVTVTGGAFAGGVTTLTAAGGTPFYPTMIGHSIVVTGIGTFSITAYTSSTVITVSGDASSAAADTFSITGDGVYRLPSDFDTPDAPSMAWAESIYAEPPRLCDERMVVGLRARDSSTGYPQFASIRWVTTDGTAEQQKELIVYPRCGDDYDAVLPYMVHPVGMSTANPYPKGGPEMADVLLSCVLAICEEERSGTRGDRWGEFLVKVNNAAKRDRTRHHNFNAGYMRFDGMGTRLGFKVKDLIQTTDGT